MKLLNASQLANELERSRTYVSAMKKAGFRFEYGMRTTLASAMRWLRANPDFRVTEYAAGKKRSASTSRRVGGKRAG